MKSEIFNRYLWLIRTLMQFGRLSFKELDEKWMMSSVSNGKSLNIRTFHKYRNAVEELFGINILCEKCGEFRYYIEDTTYLERDKLIKWMMNSFSAANLVREGQGMYERIILEEIPKGFDLLDKVISAMKGNYVLKIHYQPFYGDEISVFHVAPYFMRLYHQRWYVLGFFREREGIRHFALDRTEGMEVTSEKFDYPMDFSPEEYYRNSIGIWTDTSLKPEKVVLRAYGLQSKYFRTLPFHHTQKEIKTTAEYTDFEYNLCITTDLVMEILSKGSRVEVISPDGLREKIMRNLSGIYNRYKK